MSVKTYELYGGPMDGEFVGIEKDHDYWITQVDPDFGWSNIKEDEIIPTQTGLYARSVTNPDRLEWKGWC